VNDWKVLDTDTLSALVKPSRPTRLQRELAALGAWLTTVVNLAELWYGVRRAPNSERLLDVYERRVFPHLRLVPFDEPCAPVYGDVRAALEREGSPLGAADLFIAAICVRHGATLVTGNVRHFSRVPGLRLENWLGDD
jgi:tRNA(fMet)-specific endonuclease VapC